MKSNQKYDFTIYFDEFLRTEKNNRQAFYERIAKELGCNYKYAGKQLNIMRLRIEKLNSRANELNALKTKIELERSIKPEPTASELIQADRQLNKERSNSRIAEQKYNQLLKDYEDLEKRFDFLISIKEDSEAEKIIPKQSDQNKNIATPIILLSDWHFEERVEPHTINGLNEYNLEIGQKRWSKCIQNSLRLVNIDRNHSEINTLVIWLGGDFITGYIHEELQESNYLSPTQASRFAKKSIISALEFYLQYGKFDKIEVVCSFGNHGRTTQKKRHSTAYKNSFEWMVYHDVADYFSDNLKISFRIPDGYFTYLTIYDFVCRFWHGDTIKYQGGIGGITIPLIKAIHRYNQQINANYNFMGHYHQLFQATKDCIVNGSGIGFNSYAQNIGASPEQPMQSYCLIDQKRGMTIKAPIFCE